MFSHGRRSVRWNRDDRYRVRRKRARLWNTQAFSTAMVVLACLSMLVSLWQMAENKLTEEGLNIRFRSALYRNIVQIVCVNLLFLVIRAVVFFVFGKNESIFIKNGIAIVLSILEIRRNRRRLRRVGQEPRQV